MKRLSLEKTWKYCLSMWGWIAKRKKEGDRRPTPMLKAVWIKKHDFGKDEIQDDCFFCHYISDKLECSQCPGKRIDENFDCYDPDYCWYSQPIAFYNKLVSLNRKRQKAKQS